MRIGHRGKKISASSAGPRQVAPASVNPTSSSIISPSWFTLESRIMFDGAAVATAGTVGTEQLAQQQADASFEGAEATTFDRTPAAPTGEPQFTSSDQALFEALAAYDISAARQEIVFISTSVREYRQLLDNISPNAEIVVLDTNRDAVEQMAAALSGRTEVAAIHIISHGNAGELQLGTTVLNRATVAGRYAEDMATIAASLTANADLLLYGCDVAAGEVGRQFVSALAAAIGADVAASTDLTGAAVLGGDWQLEARTGSIEAALPLSLEGVQGYGHLLAVTAITDSFTDPSRILSEDTFGAITGLVITDTDNPASMTLRLQSTHGMAQIGNLSGAIVSIGINGTADFTLSGSLVQLNNALATLSWKGDLNQNSNTAGFTPALALTATDVTNGGSSVYSIPSITVTSVNDAPDLSTQVPLTVSEGGNNAFSLAQLAASAIALDPDIATGQQVLAQQMVTVTSLPTRGTLSHNGGVVVVGSVIPVSSLSSLVYTHNGTDIASNTSDVVGITVSDGGGATTSGTISITVTPNNVAPSVSGAPSLIEGQVKVVAPFISFGDSFDTLANATIVIDNIVTGGQGTLFIDADADNVIDTGEALSGTVTLDATQRSNLATQLKFFQNGAEPNAPGAVAPSYRITVTDAGGGEGAGSALIGQSTVTLSVSPNNDDPTLTNAHATPGTALVIAEGVSTLLTSAMLQISDADRNLADISQTTLANQLVYTIGIRPTQGEIQLFVDGGAGPDVDGWVTLDTGSRVTQADIDAGRVRYYQTTDVASNTADGFTFTVRDSAFGYDVWTDPANPTGGREGGLRASPTGAIATQTFNIDIAASTNPHTNPYTGAPRSATPGYGGNNTVYSFAPNPIAMTNGNGSVTWNESNVGEPTGGYVITNAMLGYTITLTDNNGTPGNTSDDVTTVLPPAATVYTLTSLPPNGIVQRLASGAWTAIPPNGQFTQADVNAGNIRFVSDGGEDHIASFGYTVSDGTGNKFDSSFALNLTPVNDRPTGSGGVVQVSEGTNNTIRLGGAVIGMSDVDLSLDPAKQTGEGAQDFLWFQITSQAVDGGSTAHGQLQHWNGSAWVNVAVGEWLPSTLLTASADGSTSGLRYVHDGSEPLTYSGGSNLSFTYLVRDDLANPGNAFTTDISTPTLTDGSAQSNQSAPATATIQVIPVNNAPQVADKPGDSDPIIPATIVDGGALTGVNEGLAGVREGGTATITSAHLTAVDPDSTTVQRQYRITQASTLGVLQLNGVALGVGSTFTQADIDTGKLSYKHNGSEVGTLTTDAFGTYHDKFHFVVNDGVAEDAGAGADNNVFLITLDPTNDKPTLTAPAVPIEIDSANAANNPVTGFVVADPDVTGGLVAGETDFVQVSVRILDAAGNPITDYTIGFAGGGVSIGYSNQSGGLWAVTESGSNDILQIQGSRAQVNAALAGLSVTFVNDANAPYKLQVIVDDRMRDVFGALTTTGSDANGGELNQPAAIGGPPTAVPTTVYDWMSAATPVATDPNITTATVDLRASHTNEPTTFTGPATITVNEDTRTQINGFVVSDPESAAFDTPVTVTLSVGSGTLGIGSAGAHTNITPAGGQAVTIVGDNTASVTLTGRAADIQALLNGRNFANTANDGNGGLFYTSASDVNHDTNGGSAGDVSLTLSLNDSGSRIGGDTGAGSVANNPADIVTSLDLTAINDASVVNRTATSVTISGTATTAVSGFTITDVDSNNGYTVGETDGTIQATVRVLDNSGNPLASTTYAGLGITLNTSAIGHGATVDATLDGVNGALELRGTLTQINAYLAGLQVAFANLTNANLDTSYSIEVVADDRLRDLVPGALTGNANGGANNQQTGPPAVPSTDTFDAYSTTVSAYGLYNVTRNTRPLFISTINDPATMTANNVTVNEGSATLILNAGNANITVADPDDNGSTAISATVTVSKGTITAVGGAGGSVAGTGTSTITITGATEAQLNTRLQALTVTFPDETGAPTAADWNGGFNVTVVYNDGGNTGGRPATLTGDTNNATANPGDYSYADGVSNILVTTRTFTVTVNGINDAPVRTDATPVTLPAATEDVHSGSGDMVSNLFAGKFSDTRDGITGGTSPNTFAGIAITINNAIPAQGTWQYSTDGTNWTDLPAVSTASAFLLKPTDSLRFDPAADFHGTPGGLDARLVDDSGGAVTTGTIVNVTTSGGTTRYSDGSNSVTLNISITNVNDRPTGTNTTLASINEDTTNPSGATVASLGFGYADATDNRTAITGGGNAASAFGGITIVGNSADAAIQGVWQYDIGGGWQTIGSGGLSPTDTAAIILPTTASLRFVPVANYTGTPGVLDVRTADSAQAFSASSDISATVGSQTSTWSVSRTLETAVLPVNDEPTLSATGVNPTFTEDGSAVDLFSGVTASTVEAGQTLTRLDFTVTNVTDGAAERITVDGTTIQLTNGNSGTTATNSLSYQVTVASGTATVSLTKVAGITTAQMQTLVDGMTYQNTSQDPTAANRVVTLIRLDDNGSNTAPNDNTATLNHTSTVTVTPVNDPPVLTGDLTATVNEGATYVLTATDLGFTDVDDVAAGVTFSVSSLTNGTVRVNGVVATTFTGTQLAAGQVSFQHNGSETTSASFLVNVEDGNEDGSAPVNSTFTFTVTPLNDPPVGVNDTIPVTVNTPVTQNVLSNDTDVDGNPLTIAEASIDTNGDGTPNALTLGTATPITDNLGNPIGSIMVNANGTVTFSPALNYTGPVPNLTYTLNDGTVNGSPATVSFGLITFPPILATSGELNQIQDARSGFDVWREEPKRVEAERVVLERRYPWIYDSQTMQKWPHIGGFYVPATNNNPNGVWSYDMTSGVWNYPMDRGLLDLERQHGKLSADEVQQAGASRAEGSLRAVSAQKGEAPSVDAASTVVEGDEAQGTVAKGALVESVVSAPE